MSEMELRGIRCITLVRAAIFALPETVSQQLRNLQGYAEQHGMPVVGRLILNGVAHGVPKSDLTALLSRKRGANDFDALLVTEPSRVARDQPHSVSVFNMLKRAGIRVICTMQAIGDHDWMMRENFAECAYTLVRQQRRLRRQLRHE
jgi:DNA invertase Pin-like site-specific DNA recombinase